MLQSHPPFQAQLYILIVRSYVQVVFFLQYYLVLILRNDEEPAFHSSRVRADL